MGSAYHHSCLPEPHVSVAVVHLHVVVGKATYQVRCGDWNVTPLVTHTWFKECARASVVVAYMYLQ
jgi:hypothetical protein